AMRARHAIAWKPGSAPRSRTTRASPSPCNSSIPAHSLGARARPSTSSTNAPPLPEVPAVVEILSFETPVAFRAWLVKHYKRSSGIWLRIYKKGSGIATISYAAALDEALCFGWIDGQKQSGDDESWLQKFT